jgi:hypothetical protein
MQRFNRPGSLAQLILLLALTTLLRYPALHTAVINWDETIYALVADAWLHGHPPYTSVWDNKPPLLYLLFAIFQKLIADPVTAIRVLGIVAATATAALVGRLAVRCGASANAACLASLAFVLGSLCNGGLATNAELLMVVFTSAAMLAAVSGRAFYAGLGLGAAICVKHVAVFEIFALLAALLAGRGQKVRIFFRFSLGGAIVALALLAGLACAGSLAGFWQEAVVDDVLRVSGTFDGAALRHSFAAQSCWIMLYASLLLLRDRAVWLWLLCGCLGIISGKYFYTHYFIQILPALCVAFALATDRLLLQRKHGVAFALVLLIPTLAGGVYKLSSLARAPHDERAIAARLAGGTSLYVFDSEPVLYLLTGAVPPTAYVLPTILSGRLFYAMAGIDPLHEIGRIFGTHPEFVVTQADSFAPRRAGADRNPAAYALVQRWLTGDYDVFARFPDAVVYRYHGAVAGLAAAPGERGPKQALVF